MTSATDGYSLMVSLRPYLFPTFAEDQEAAALKLYSVLHPLLIGNMVTNVVDLGCGTGEILHALAWRSQLEMSSRISGDDLKKRLSELHFIGIDSDAKEIARAKALTVENVDVNWVAGAAEDLCTLWHPPSGNSEREIDRAFPKHFDWSRTLVLCTGHTLPHFRNRFCKFLATQRPKYFLFDLFHTFDAALSYLDSHTKASFEEAMSWVHSAEDVDGALLALGEAVSRDISPSHSHPARLLFVRRTRINDNCHTTVDRSCEVWGYAADGRFVDKAPMSLFSVIQKRRSSDDYRKMMEASSLAYRLDKQITYSAGYGHMRGYLFVAECEHAVTMNRAFEAASCELQSRILTQSFLQQLHVAKSINSITVLPFDRHYTYAVYSTAPAFSKRRQPDCTMVLTDTPLASEIYLNRPLVPAPALHSCLLGDGSIANVLPLKEQKEFLIHRLGKGIHDALAREEAYLAPCNHSLYFLLPIFIGRLPLFCLVADFGPTLDPKVTHQDVYDEVLLSWRSLLDSLIQSRVVDHFMRPFVHFAVEGLVNANRLQAGGASERREVTRIRAQLIEAWEAAGQKRWHSWAHMIPSRPVSEAQPIVEQQKWVHECLVGVVDDVLADPIVKGIRWARHADYFASKSQGGKGDGRNPHDTVTESHRGRRIRMLEVASKNKAGPNVASAALTELGRSIPGRAYFFSARHLTKDGLCPELLWLAKMVDISVDAPPGLNLDVEAEKRPPTPQYSRCKQAYLKAKSVFCGTLANREDTLRFSLWRICCFFEMYNAEIQFLPLVDNGTVSVTDSDRLLYDATGDDPFTKFAVVGDCSEQLRQFARLLAGRCSRLCIEVSAPTVTAKAADVACRLVATCSGMAANRGDSAEYVLWVNQHCRHQYGSMESIPTAWTSCTLEWTLRFASKYHSNSSMYRVDTKHAGAWVLDEAGRGFGAEVTA